MSKMRVLVVDDELSIHKLLRAILEENGFVVTAAIDGAEALRKCEIEPPDLIILDINMPNIDGFEVSRRLREWSQVPIIMVSALSGESDKVRCLELGADDYITKPFSPGELIARVKAVLRRTRIAGSVPVRPSFNCGDMCINFARRQVTVAGKEISLTPTEYNLLQEMALNSGKVLTHTQLLNKVWGPEYFDEREYLHVFVGRLRTKLEPEPKRTGYIITIPGVGYQLKGPS